jgi:hypothetical protein
MPEQIATGEWLCFDEFDVSGLSDNFGSKRTVAEETWTPFQGPTEDATVPLLPRRLLGVESMTLSTTGQLDAAVNLAAAEAALARGSAIVTKGDGRALGDQVYMFVGRAGGDFVYGGAVGKVIPFSAMVGSDGIVTVGQLFEFGSKSSTAPGTSRTMPVVTTGMSLYLHLHVVAKTGSGSMVFVYETSLIGDYTDAVVKYTSPSISTVDKKRAVVSSANSDTHHRWRMTLTGSGTFLVRLAAGVR